MMRILLMIALLSALPAMASDWSSLWRNADQRGDRLLQQGNAAAAAKVYANPRRKAYAEIQSGNYKSAIGQLAAVDEGDAHYNRGIALAHIGDLQGALHAFDAALKLDPKNKDARYNRALVAKVLKQNQPKPQDKKSSSDPKKDQNKKGKQGKQGNKGNKDKQGNNPDNTNKKQDAASPKPEKKSDQGKSGKSSDQTKAKTANSNDASKATKDTSKDAAQAKLDAQSSLAKPGKIDHNLAAKPPSEKQLAQAQWLRNIPDDPSGLLRRKFLIEYMMRKQQAQP